MSEQAQGEIGNRADGTDRTVTPPAAGTSGASFAAVLAGLGVDVLACFQCGRCSSGCPLVPDCDLMPMEAVRMACWGMEADLAASRAVWLCSGCATCASRCPNSIDIALLHDVVRQRALGRGVEPALPRIPAFHRSFLGSVRRWGRTWELGMIVAYKLRSGDLFGDMGLGLRMFGQGKLHLLPRSIEGKDEVRAIFERAGRHAAPKAGEP